MISLLLAALFFDGLHFFIAGSSMRAKIVAKVGEEGFQSFFAVLSLVGIVWLCRAYGRADYVELWGQVQALRFLALVAMLIAFTFAVFAFTSPNPTAVRGGAVLIEKDPVKGIERITRHPFLCGVALWSFTHLVFNGDLASLIFFGAFLALALLGPRSIDRKRAKVYGEAWDRFAATTSIVPFMAILEGRNTLNLKELRWWEFVISIILFGFFLHMHRSFFGVSPLPQ
jgi:uncharacterized membrane protein